MVTTRSKTRHEKEDENPASLQALLLLGVLFFLVMSVAHFYSLKYPFLFVFYNTPFYRYQDRIISFTLLTYAALFFTAAQCRRAVPAAIFSMGSTAAMLTCLVCSPLMEEEMLQGMSSQLREESVRMYWVQIGALGLYALVLAVLYTQGNGYANEAKKNA